MEEHCEHVRLSRSDERGESDTVDGVLQLSVVEDNDGSLIESFKSVYGATPSISSKDSYLASQLCGVRRQVPTCDLSDLPSRLG